MSVSERDFLQKAWESSTYRVTGYEVEERPRDENGQIVAGRAWVFDFGNGVASLGYYNNRDHYISGRSEPRLFEEWMPGDAFRFKLEAARTAFRRHHKLADEAPR